MSDPCSPERPNEVGESPVLIRWIVETERGWLGAWHREPLAEYCDLKQQLAEARQAQRYVSTALSTCVERLDEARAALVECKQRLAEWQAKYAAALKAAREERSHERA